MELNKYYKELLRLHKGNRKEFEKYLNEVFKNAYDEIINMLNYYLLSTQHLSFAQMLNANRLQSLLDQISERTGLLYDDIYSKMYKEEIQEFKDQYLGIFYEIEKVAKIQMDFSMVNDRVIKKAIELPIAGIPLSRRLYKEQLPKLQKDIKKAVTQSLITGNGLYGTANQVKKSFDMSKEHAILIARTETGRIRSTARQQAQEEAVKKGVNLQKKWLATLDTRTREDHQELDGQTVDVDKPFKLGIYTAMQPRMFRVAKEDINCRCDTITIVEGISPKLRRDNIDKTIIDYVNYNDWKQNREPSLLST